MDMSSDQYQSKVSRQGTLSALLVTVLSLARRLIGFFMLTEEDRSEAGICVGCEEHYT